MTPYEEAKKTANEIALAKLAGMFVTISVGGEYVNSYDVEATVPTSTKEAIQAIQRRLNELGAKPKLEEDGIMGRMTLNAILTALRPAVKS
jgi:lysozyme family protein